MRYLLTLCLAASLFACGSDEPESVSGGYMPHEQYVGFSNKFHEYDCKSGEEIEVSYPDADTAIVKYKGEKYPMKNAVTASGARYTGKQFEWWSKGVGKGAKGALFKHLPSGASGDMLEQCEYD